MWDRWPRCLDESKVLQLPSEHADWKIERTPFTPAKMHHLATGLDVRISPPNLKSGEVGYRHKATRPPGLSAYKRGKLIKQAYRIADYWSVQWAADDEARDAELLKQCYRSMMEEAKAEEEYERIHGRPLIGEWPLRMLHRGCALGRQPVRG